MRLFAKGFQALKRAFAPRSWMLAAHLIALAILGVATAQAQSSLCAEVKIEIKQKVSLERQAFDAVLRIRNGLDATSIDAVGVNVVFKDGTGNPVIASSDPNNTAASFFLRLDSLSGISAVDGSGSVAPSSVGEVHWLIIPASGAGGSSPFGAQYFVGATISYRLGGEDKSVEVTPESITVKPQPQLELDYFLASDVYADDPFTPAIEPTEPFTLGVRVKNTGAGLAHNTTIESAQPKIVENRQGLLIGFQIVDSYVDDHSAEPTLLLNFGDIPAGGARMGRWNMTTTLAGRFVDFDATYTHADSLGGALTSLLKRVDTHPLVHDVRVDLSGRDTVRDFLALDGDVLRVYESDSADTVATDQSSAAHLQSGASPGQLTLDLPATTGFAYASVTDPFNGQQRNITAVRSDGKRLPSENIWLSKKRNADLSWNYYLNLFDANTPGHYSLSTGQAPSTASISGVVYEDVDGDGQRGATEPALAAVPLTLKGTQLDGQLVELTGVSSANGAFQFSGLAAGTYSLQLGDVSGFVNGTHQAGSAGGVVTSRSIDQVVLQEGVAGSGYLFAKRRAQSAVLSDLQLTAWSTSTNQPKIGQEVVLSLAVANAGPSATLAAADFTLPAAFQLTSAEASTGGFDLQQKRWSIGTIAANASATLSIHGHFTSAGTYTASATIQAVGTASADPEPQNNTRQIGVTVPAAQPLVLTETLLRESRVLALASCAGQTTDATACAQTRATRLDSLLGNVGAAHLVVTTATAFRDELRSGHWNTYWISGGAAKLEAGLLAELREAVVRGDGLLLDGTRDSSSAALETLAGASFVAVLDGASHTVTVPTRTGWSAWQLSSAGVAYRYTATAGTVLGTFEDASAAVIRGPSGAGRAILFAFDVVETLNGSANTGFAREATRAALPDLAPVMMADAYAAIVLQTVGDSALAIQQSLSAPAGARIVTAAPAPQTISPLQALWSGTLDTDGAYVSTAGLRLPTASGDYVLLARAQPASGNAQAVEQTLTVPVRSTADQAQLVSQTLTALAVSSTADIALKAQAQTAMSAALSARTSAQYATAIAKALDAIAAIAQITGVPTADLHVEFSRLLQAIEREWYTALVSCSANVESPIRDSGQGYTPFNSLERLEARGGSAGAAEWEWALGTNTQQASKFASADLAWVSGKPYQWTLSYDGAGHGSFNVRDGSTVVASAAYPATGGELLHVGNGVQIAVTANSGAGNTRMNVQVTKLNTSPLVDALSTPGQGQTGTTALYYYYPAMVSGFSLEGTATLTFNGAKPASGSRVQFTVTPGQTSCGRAER